MSKRFSILCTVVLVAVALLGSAMLLPALHNRTPGHPVESVSKQQHSAPAQSIMQRTADKTASGATEPAGSAGTIIDYTFIFTENDEVIRD
jgi:hypothetical protein